MCATYLVGYSKTNRLGMARNLEEIN